jgi:hypothetical protein
MPGTIKAQDVFSERNRKEEPQSPGARRPARQKGRRPQTNPTSSSFFLFFLSLSPLSAGNERTVRSGGRGVWDFYGSALFLVKTHCGIEIYMI